MSIEPWINWQFHKAPGLIDPRASFSRASTARTVGRTGALITKPANAARFRFNPVTGLSEGLLVEQQRTNLLLRSEELNNAAWTATGATVTANSTAAPDGATTADTVAATAPGGNVAQAVTITAGRGIALSVFFRANATAWAWMQITDGTNAVECWFNLADGVVGANTAGAATNVFSQKTIEKMGGGWFRCALETTTVTSTGFTARFGPAAADSAAPASGNSLFAWGTQLEADSALNSLTSYISTTSGTGTRNADNLLLPVTSAEVPLDRGTMVFEWLQRPRPPSNGGQGLVLGGIGATFDNTIYPWRTGSTSLTISYRAGGVDAPGVTRTCAFAPGTIYRAGVAWAPGRLAFCLDGGVVTTGTAGITPFGSVARIGVGGGPWTAVASGSGVVHRAFIYAPHTVSDAVLQQLTAP
jgi:hypothetical protein